MKHYESPANLKGLHMYLGESTVQ